MQYCIEMEISSGWKETANINIILSVNLTYHKTLLMLAWLQALSLAMVK